MKSLVSIMLVTILFLSAFRALGQIQSSSLDKPYLYKAEDRSYIAKRTAMRSALIPGWGQFDNNQKLKIPFIYLALGTSTYLIIDNYNKYREARQAYLYRLDSNPDTEVSKYKNASTSFIESERQLYREYIDYSVLATVLIYTLNILDAAVFSHLHDFDVSEDISLRPKVYLQPYALSNTGYAATIGISLNTK